MGTVTTLPKVHRAYLADTPLNRAIMHFPSVRESIKRGFGFWEVFAIHNEYCRALVADPEGVAMPWERAQALLDGIVAAKLESYSARDLADMDRRAQHFAEIDPDNLSDAVWEALPRIMPAS